MPTRLMDEPVIEACEVGFLARVTCEGMWSEVVGLAGESIGRDRNLWFSGGQLINDSGVFARSWGLAGCRICSGGRRWSVT